MKTPHNNAPRGPGWPTFASELLAARDQLTLADHIGLALRAHRKQLGLSQRAYAFRRGWTKWFVAKLECHADRVSLADIMSALAGTGYALMLAKLSNPADGCVLAVPVQAVDWERTELIARVRGGSRRFPGHRDTRQVSNPPRWWWDRESALARSQAPHFYCPEARSDPSSVDPVEPAGRLDGTDPVEPAGRDGGDGRECWEGQKGDEGDEGDEGLSQASMSA